MKKEEEKKRRKTETEPWCTCVAEFTAVGQIKIYHPFDLGYLSREWDGDGDGDGVVLVR